MSVSRAERISHVIRRLSMGAHPELVARAHDTDEALATAFDLSAPPPVPLPMVPPADAPDARDASEIAAPIAWWVDRMRSGERLIEERLTWFWHDHFATAVQKVRVPYLMYRQHLTIRAGATGNFRSLLHAVARDPAMLIYLDGARNTVRNRNENFGRECMELFTLGRDDGYTQDDVVAASRAFTGWTVDVPGRGTRPRVFAGVAPWSAVFVSARHDAGALTFLGRRGSFDLDSALDVILARPSCARFVASKLYRELVGLDPDDATVSALAKAFGRDYEILPLVRAIAARPEFLSDAAVRSKVRSPVEKLVALIQASGREPALGTLGAGAVKRGGGMGAYGALRTLGYLPFNPPNVAGYPKGARLVGPAQFVHAFDLLAAFGGPPNVTDAAPTALLARFGVFDASSRTLDGLSREADPRRRFVLAYGSPEVALI